MTHNQNAPQTQRVTTHQLRKGDVVLEHGMRVRLDEEPTKSPTAHGECWSFPGTVLNLEEVRTARFVPMSFLRTQKWKGGWVTDREDFWTVQGNELAHWTVARD